MVLAIAAIVGIYEIVSTIIDFQFTSTILHYVDGSARGQHFANVFAFTNVVSLLVQLFLTGFVMQRFGILVALLVSPLVLLGASGIFMLAPVLLVGSFLNTADNGFSYSINQSARESLYVPTSVEEKYKAKAFIDMFVQRFAKAVAVGITLLITSHFHDFDGVRWLSLINVVLILVWIYAVFVAGKHLKKLESA